MKEFEKEKSHYPDHLSHIFPEYYVLKVSGFDLKIRHTLHEWVYALKEAEVKPAFKAKGMKEDGEKRMRLHWSQEERHAYERYIGAISISEDFRTSTSSIETFIV